MNVQVQAQGLPRAAVVRQYAGKKIRLALTRFAHLIEGVSVRLSDINGPERGGVDKLCRVVVCLKNHSSLVVEDLGSDIDRAIDRTADRLYRTLALQPGRLARAG